MPGSDSYKGYGHLHTTDSEYEPSYTSSPLRQNRATSDNDGEGFETFEDHQDSDSNMDFGQHDPAPSSDDIPLSVARNHTVSRLAPRRTHHPVHYTFDRPRIPSLFNHLPVLSSELVSAEMHTSESTLAFPSSDPVDGPIDFYSPRTERKIKMTLKGKRKAATLNEGRKARQYQAEEDVRQRQAIKEQAFKDALDILWSSKCSLAEFLDYVFNPQTFFDDPEQDWRWKGFFKHKFTVRRIFGYWSTSDYSTAAQSIVNDWAVDRVAKLTRDEANAITQSGIVSKANRDINEGFFLDYSIPELTNTLETMAPSLFRVLKSFATTTRQTTQLSVEWLGKKKMMIGSAVLTLIHARSQKNNYSQSVHGTYLLATGAQRQHFSIFKALGVSVSYGSVFDRRRPSHITPVPSAPKKRPRMMGLLSLLSLACRKTTRNLAKTYLYIIVYDNINMMVRVAEQVLGRKNAQENGTCATVMPLFNAKLEDLDVKKLDEGFQKSKDLTIEDLELTDIEADLLDDALAYTVASIVVRHGGSAFSKFATDLEKKKPASDETIEVHQTPIHPLPSMEIDESTIVGNVEIMETINRELHGPAGEAEATNGNPQHVQLLSGDQLTLQRQRSVATIRAGHEVGLNSWRHLVLVPGLFHAKIADCHGLLVTHFGISSIRSPGSLSYHNTCLDRIPIVLSSLPSFRVCRDLIMISLYARVLHCLLLVSKTTSLDEYIRQYPSVDELLHYSRQVLLQFANAERVRELREPRETERRKLLAKEKAEKEAQLAKERAEREAAKASGIVPDPLPRPKPKPKTSSEPIPRPPHTGDEVYENAQLFMRDALFTRLFSDAVKAGDSGMVVIVLKIWTLSYRGSGRSKYAHEMLHLFHNLVNVWSKELRAIVLQNWLVNPTGKRNAFVELDLVQEHLNFWIKKVYRADGDAHSWEWLEVVSPCVEVLRKLSKKLNAELGSKQGSSHSTPDLENDIKTLMNVLHIHKVYEFVKGRMVDVKDGPVPDIQASGLAALTHAASSVHPLQEFNNEFDNMRQRRNLVPVSREAVLVQQATDSALQPPPAAHPSPQNNADVDVNPGTAQEDEVEGATVNAADDDDDTALWEVQSPTLPRLDEDDVALDMDRFDLESDMEEDGEEEGDME